jgi:hypothetical protein
MKASKTSIRARLLRCRQVASARNKTALLEKSRELTGVVFDSRERISEELLLKRIAELEAALGISYDPGIVDHEKSDTDEPVSDLRAGVAKVDITPPPGTEAVGHARIMTGVRDPLHAGVIYFENDEERALLVTLDLCGVLYREVQEIRRAIQNSTAIPEDHILVAATHNHSGPMLTADDAYGKEVIQKIAAGASKAVSDLKDVILSYGQDSIDFVVNRRLLKADGRVGGPDPNGIVDDRVRVIQISSCHEDTPLALLITAACHATFFIYKSPDVSADYPGQAMRYLEDLHQQRMMSFFFQGCCGDTRPMLMGEDGQLENADEGDIRWGGMNLAGAVLKAISPLNRRVVRQACDSHYPISVLRKEILLPARIYQPEFIENQSVLQDVEGKPHVRFDMQAIRIGQFIFLAIPGEAFSEYARKIESMSPSDVTIIIVNYANGYIGYIPTAQSYEVMGYEPSSSPLRPEAEEILLKEIKKLIAAVNR